MLCPQQVHKCSFSEWIDAISGEPLRKYISAARAAVSSCDSCLNGGVLSDCTGSAWVHGRKGVLAYFNFHFLIISFFHLIRGKKGVASDKCVDYRITSFLGFCLFIFKQKSQGMYFPNFECDLGGRPHLSGHLECQPLAWRGRSPAWRGRSSIALLSTDWGLERI